MKLYSGRLFCLAVIPYSREYNSREYKYPSALFVRESPRYLYSWGTTQRELKCCSNCKLGT